MGLFDRRRRARPEPTERRWAPQDPDPVLPILSREAAAVLERLAREAWLAQGVETVPDGAGALVAMDGRVYGLSNLAATLAPESQGTWPELVRRHVAGLVDSHATPTPLSLDEVRTQVYPRLRDRADLREPPSYADSPLPGLLELAAIDYPTHVTDLLSDESVDTLGGWEATREAAMINLRGLPMMHQDIVRADPERDDSDVHVLTSEDYFGPSRVLILAEVLAGIGIERPSHGVLVAVPNRHLLAAHVLAGPGVVAALQVLARISTGEHDHQPGAVSRHIYYVPSDGAPAQQVTSFADDGTLSIDVEGALAGAFAALGLLEG